MSRREDGWLAVRAGVWECGGGVVGFDWAPDRAVQTEQMIMEG